MCICFNGIDILGNSLSITEFSLVYVPFYLEEILEECRNLNPDERNCIGMHKMHTNTPQTSTGCLSLHQKSICVFA